MARTPRFTPEQIIRVLKQTRGMVTLAAEHLTCDGETIYNYAKRHPVVAAHTTKPAPRPAPRATTIDYAILSMAGPSDLIDEIKLMLPKRLDHLRSLTRIREAFDEPTPLDDDDYVTLLIHDALRLRQWRGGEP